MWLKLVPNFFSLKDLEYFNSLVDGIIIVFARFFTTSTNPQGGGYSQKIWVGVCGLLPKTLTLFMTKICNFPCPIYDLTKNLIPYL